MIRIVTRARLNSLEQQAEDARARAWEMEAAANTAADSHAHTARSLTTQLDTVQHAADVARAEARRLEVALGSAESGLTAARETLAKQAQQIKALQGDLDTVLGAVVLLNYGRLVSVHPTGEAARRHAESLGCPVTGWGPGSGRPASEVEWRTVLLSRFAVEDGGGAG
ncbi:hypothetical protein [Streptomyces sp. NPDC093097]|uniref:hypothetical protein n=1 Tax=Streptomyces sp. NPDC093097 TaxID=3366027 RepID=UPI003803215F